MAGPNSQVSSIDGTIDFSGGVNSVKVSTIQSERNRGGLARNELAWLNNGAVRDGGVRPRNGWLKLGQFLSAHPGIFQGSFLYTPRTGTAYLIIAIAGRIYKVDPDHPTAAVDLSTTFGLTHPATEPYFYFAQGEEFLVIQAGDYITLPLFWDGVTLRRSLGIAGAANSTIPPGLPPGIYTVTIRNDTAQAGVKVPANATSSPVGGTFTAQVGAFKTAFNVPAIGASVTVEVTQDQTSALGKVIGLSFAPPTVFTTGTWTVTAVNAASATVTPTTGVASEIPAAGPMDYYMGRLWYAAGSKFIAGDIVGGPSGTLAYAFRDGILKCTENPITLGGDGFSIASNDGNIRALKHSANIDAALGQGRLYVFTSKAIYSVVVPVTRNDWINATINNGPLISVVQLNNGSVNDRSVTSVNGDLYFRSLEPGVRSMVIATRYFSQPGNVQISANENRLMQFEDRALLKFTSGIYFNNRLLQTGLPVAKRVGAACTAIIPLDFMPVSGVEAKGNPVWEGMYQGLNHMQVLSGDFGGLERAFSIVYSDTDDAYQIWELTTSGRRDNVDSRIQFSFETPAYTWGDEAALKRLIGGELWVDQLSGTVNFKVEYRADSESCWHLWNVWMECSPANSCEDPENPICYPITPNPDSYRSTMILPQPPASCSMATGRPSTIGYQFQARITINGWCRVRGFWMHATPFERSLYSRLSC